VVNKACIINFFLSQVIAPQFKHFQKLRDFIEMKLPPGFPVKVDIPVLPTVSARVTFHDFAWKNLDKEGGSSLENIGKENQQAEAKVDSNRNGELSKDSETNVDEKSKTDTEKTDGGSSQSLAKKEKSKGGGNKEDEDPLVTDDAVSCGSVDSPHLDDSLFEIPAGYVEDNTRFPDL
jgi:hypothetical protein